MTYPLDAMFLFISSYECKHMLRNTFSKKGKELFFLIASNKNTMMENVAWKPQELFRIPIQVMIGMSVQIT